MNDRKVGFLDVGVRGEGACESFHRLLRLRDDEESRGVLVEPVDDPRTCDAADAGEIGAVVEKGVHERAGEVSGRGVDDHAGRLVDDKEVVVLEDDGEGNVLWFGNCGDGRRDLDLDFVRLRDFHAGLFGDLAVDGDVSGLHEPLDPRPGEVGIEFEYSLVQPLHGG